MPKREQPTLLLIDGHSLAFRAFYALPVDSFSTHDGQHTNAIHGFIAMLINLLKAEEPTHLAVAFDISRASFRTREYPEYKGTRNETPPEFLGQVPLLKEALHAMNITTIEKEDYEADDILATLAGQGAAAGYDVLVVSGDRDAIQMVTPTVTLLYPSRQGVTDLTRYTVDKVQERYGIRPEQYPEIAALVGETSDNLPGIPKVGEKTAVKWLNQFGSLDEILARADEIGGKVGESLREHRENAVRNRRLNRLLTDVELPVGPDDLKRRPLDADAVREVFDKLEFRTLLTRVLATEGITGDAALPTGASDGPTVPVPQTLLDEELGAWLARAAGTPVGVDVGPTIGDEVLVGLATDTETVSLTWKRDRADYAPFEAWLASDAPKVLHDAKPQLRALHSAGLELGGLEGDTLLAAYLLRPANPERDLADLVQRYLEEVLPQGDPNQLVPDESVASGPEARAWYALRVMAALRAKMDDSSAGVLARLELPVLPVLEAMEERGITVDGTHLAGLSATLGDRAAELAALAFAEIDMEVNLGSPKQLQEVLFDKLALPKTRRTKTGYTTDAAALADLYEKTGHPFLDLLLKHRDVTKLRQIIETLTASIGTDGRVHTTYLQTGASTGRLASTDPNLQNIPVRSEEGRRIREAFRAGEGFETLMTADYSQIEMRIMAHLSEDAGLIEAFTAGEDLHSFVGSRVFGVGTDEVTGEMRSKVKAMSYGLAYGLSAFGLSRQLGIDVPDARTLVSDYFARFGGVRDYLRNVVEQAKVDGYTETIDGRRRFFPELSSPNRVLRENAERQALNAPIQGSAADIMKRAMVEIERDVADAGLRSQMLLQVHDELIFEVAPGEWDALERIVLERMSTAATLRVPLEVHVGRGVDWNAAAH